METKFSKAFDKYFSETAIENAVFEKIINKYEILDSKFSLFDGMDKLIHSTLQSLDIKFGYYLEEIVSIICSQKEGVRILPTKVQVGDKILENDLSLEYDNTTYIIEIKKRDNHDSTKKIGQISNLIDKYNNSSETKKKALIFFMDKSYGKKNNSYYINEWKEKVGNNDFDIWYEEEFFDNMAFLNDGDKETFLIEVDQTSEKVSNYINKLLMKTENDEGKIFFLEQSQSYLERTYKSETAKDKYKQRIQEALFKE